MGFTSVGRQRISACCKFCEDRYPGCHDHCETYQDALKEWREYNDKIRQAKKVDEYDLHKMAQIRKIKRENQ